MISSANLTLSLGRMALPLTVICSVLIHVCSLARECSGNNWAKALSSLKPAYSGGTINTRWNCDIMKQLKSIVSGLILLVFLIGCQSQYDPLANTSSEQRLYDEGLAALKARNHKLAIEKFETLDVRFPFSKHAEQTKLNMIYAHYITEDYPAAVAAADRFIRVYPRSKTVDYAYYMRGASYYERDRTFFQHYLPIDLSRRDQTARRKAFNDFNELIRRFPKSEYTPDARQRMVHLRHLFAQKELHVAEYYLKRRAYIAAIKRASYVVQHYQESESVRPALKLMVKAYTELGMKENADEARRVLALNR